MRRVRGPAVVLAIALTTAACATSPRLVAAPQPQTSVVSSPSSSGAASSPSASPSSSPQPSASPTKPKPSPTHAAPALSGIGAEDAANWFSWLGRPDQIDVTWNDAKDSSGNVTWDKMDGLYSTWGAAGGSGKRTVPLSLGQPMFAAGETVQSCATSAEITTWAKDLLRAWPGQSVYIRLGWEFDGNWYGWGVKNGEQAAFKSCWIKWYGLVKAVSKGFRLVWNPNSQSSDSKLDVRTFWPGKAYVDAAGPDEYALSWGGKLMSPNQLGPNGEPLGIAAWATWVAHQGVPLAVPEWAIHDGVTWGSIDPAYIQQMHDAFAKAAKSSTGLAFEAYFDGGTGYQCVFSIHDKSCGYDKHPADATLYQSLWKHAYSTS